MVFPSGRMKLSINNFLPLSPNEIRKENSQYINIPIMMGATKHDGSFFLASNFKEIVNINLT